MNHSFEEIVEKCIKITKGLDRLTHRISRVNLKKLES